MNHFNRIPRRRAEFIKVPNTLKAKVGSGGLSEEILNMAQKLLEEHTLDFTPLAQMYLDALAEGIDVARGYRNIDDSENTIAMMLYPAMQLKANGSMFRYNLVTRIADKMIQFLEIIEEPDIECVEIVMAFHTSLKAIVHGRIMGDGGDNGKDLQQALNQACLRYLERHPPQIDFV